MSIYLTITANLATLSGGAEVAKVTCALIAPNLPIGTIPRVVGTFVIVDPFQQTPSPLVSSSVSFTVVHPNNIVPNSSTNQWLYQFSFYNSRNQLTAQGSYDLSALGAGSTTDITQLTPEEEPASVTPAPPSGAVLLAPTGAQTILTYLLNCAGGVQSQGLPVSVYLADVINVMNPAYGVLANGVANDTAGIQAAFNAVTSRQNIVYFPNAPSGGFYNISSYITDPSSGYLQGVVGEAGGVVNSVTIKNTTNGQFFLFTHMSALGFKFQNFYFVGPGRGVASSDGIIFANVTGAKTAVSNVTAGTGDGHSVYSVSSTSGVGSGQIYMTGFSNASNNGIFGIASHVTNTSITLFNNVATTTDTGFYQTCANIGEMAIDNIQISGIGGSAAFGLRWISPIVCRASQIRILTGSNGFQIYGGTSTHVDSSYMLSLDKVGYDIPNASYHILCGCAADNCGTSYRVYRGSNAVGIYSSGCEARTAYNLTVTNTQVVGNVATITYSGPDQSFDFTADGDCVIAGTTNGSGALNGRFNMHFMIGNTVVLFGSFTNFASAADTGTISIHCGDGYHFENGNNIMAYNCKSTQPNQTTSAAGVVLVCPNSGFRDCNFNQGPGSLETNSIWISGTASAVISNCQLASPPNNFGNEALNYQGLSFQPNLTATSGNNYGSRSLQFTSSVWTGAAPTSAFFDVQTLPGSGANPTVDLQFTFSPASSTSNPQVQWLFPAGTSGWSNQHINSTAATNSQNYPAGAYQFQGQAWNSSVSIADNWTITHSLGSGANPTSSLTINQSGSSGVATFSVQEVTSIGSGASVTSNAMLTVNGTINGNGGYSYGGNSAFVAQATNDLMATIYGSALSVNVNGQTGVKFYGVRGATQNASFTGTPSIVADVVADGSVSAGASNYGFYEPGNNPNLLGGALTVSGLVTASASAVVTGTLTVSGNIGFNGASPTAATTGWGSSTGGVVVNNYNITDAGGANSNTNKVVAELITILKAVGIIKA